MSFSENNKPSQSILKSHIDKASENDDAENSSEDNNVLFVDGGDLFQCAVVANAPDQPGKTLDNSASNLLYQPGAIIQCFDLAVASHDDTTVRAPWKAPPTTSQGVIVRTSLERSTWMLQQRLLHDHDDDISLDHSEVLAEDNGYYLSSWNPTIDVSMDRETLAEEEDELLAMANTPIPSELGFTREET